MAAPSHKAPAAPQSSDKANTVCELDDMSYDFSRYLRMPDRHIILTAAVLTGLVYAYFLSQPYLLTLTSILFWQRGPLCIDAPRPEDSRCHPRSLCRPHLPGVEVLKIEAAEVRNYSLGETPFWLSNSSKSSYFAPSFSGIDFCNITVTYTHPGFDDEIHVSVHLPKKNAWNGRFQGTGGGGFMVGFGFSLFAPVARGWAAASTDGGVASGDPSDWALSSRGNVNFNTLHTYGSTAVGDMTIIGQQLTSYYYGKEPKFSYWNGCSTGGRQGIQLAQSHPDLYDGILASAPALHIPSLATSMYWPQILMQEMKSWVQPCELQALTGAAVAACDKLDGVVDGIISAPEKCRAVFDPFKLVDATLPCLDHPQGLITITNTAAKLVSAIWSGSATVQGYQLFPPILHQANLAALARTRCSAPRSLNHSPKCRGLPNILAAQWIQLFLLRKHFPPSTTIAGNLTQRSLTAQGADPYADLFALTRQDYDDLFTMANREYHSVVGSDDPDLSRFAKSGGKMITWHGLADDLIPPGGSIEYFESVLEHYKKYLKRYSPPGTDARNKADAERPVSVNGVTDFYRLYLAPGVGHCMSGPGPYPGMAWDSAGALDQLVAWVENGTVPETLNAISDGDAEGRRIRRPLCTYPKVAKYRGKTGKEREAEGWDCEDSK